MNEAVQLEFLRQLPAILAAVGTLITAIVAGMAAWFAYCNGKIATATHGLVNGRQDRMDAERQAALEAETSSRRLVENLREQLALAQSQITAAAITSPVPAASTLLNKS